MTALHRLHAEQGQSPWLDFVDRARTAELPRIRSHDLRHTFATLQLAAGTNPKIVSEMLGHKDVHIRLDRYSHALPTLQAEAMGRQGLSRARTAPAEHE